jgi:raffinose/stachyose/melibiose transport system permease protein
MWLSRYTWKTFARESLFVAGAVVFAVPLYLLITISLKTTPEVFGSALSLPKTPLISNYRDAWRQGSLGAATVDSLIITISCVTGLIVLGSLCAWTIARRGSRLGTALYFLFVVAIILPFQLAIIPLYVAFRHLDLLGTLHGVVLINLSLFMPLTVFLYVGFIRAMPKDYEEAAQVDGAGLFRTFFRVVFPMLRPVTGTVAVLTGLLIWNEFFLPLLFLSGSEHQTLPIAVYGFVSEFTAQWNVIFAAIAMAIIPILAFYLFVQKQLIRGFTGGIRG